MPDDKDKKDDVKKKVDIYEIGTDQEDDTTSDDQHEDYDTFQEQRAAANGHVSKEEWIEQGKDPNEWLDAKTFNIRGELLGKIIHQNKQLSSYDKKIKDLTKALKTLGEHNKKIQEIEYKKALAELKRNKVDALQSDDHEAIVEIDEQINELKQAKKEVDDSPEDIVEDDTSADTSQEGGIPIEIMEYLDNPANAWYHTNAAMRYAADGHATVLRKENPNLTPAELVKKVDEFVKEQFPDRFGIKKAAVSKVGVGNPSTTKNRGANSKYTIRDLDEDTQHIVRTLVRSGTFESEQAYVDQLEKIGYFADKR
jgi:hypothetical protein